MCVAACGMFSGVSTCSRRWSRQL